MAQRAQAVLEPRKSPVQVRSAATVEAIAEATIQVLLNDGPDRLTTTRVAERAGVSVGTLYQYYPNKQSLLFAVLDDHLDKVSSAVEAACAGALGKPLAEMVSDVVDAFVDAKIRHPDISNALYRIAAEVDGPLLARRMGQRSQKAIVLMLRTAPDGSLPQEAFPVQIMFAAMTGATRSVLEAGGSAAMIRNLRDHLVLLCRSYLAAAAGRRSGR